MRAYSEDLRKKIVAALERGMSKAQAARLFDVSLSSVSSATQEPLEKEGRLSPERALDGLARPTRKPEFSSKRT
jgi:transposase